MNRELRVLILAYACEPDKGSEPGVGWNWTKQIAKRHEVWVLTRANNRESIERELEQNPMPGAHFVYLDLPYWMRFWKQGQRGIHLYYYLWQIAAFIRARRLCREVSFDLAHQVTFVCDWMPSLLSLLPIPLVWGPIGSQQAPKPLKSEIGWRGQTQEYIRSVVRYFVQHFDPLFISTLRRSKAIIAVDHGTASRIPYAQSRKVEIIPQSGVSFSELPARQNISKQAGSMSYAPSEQLMVLGIGRFIYVKGFSLAIKAFAAFVQRYPQARLILIGRGAEYDRLKRIVAENLIEDKVEFYDWMPRTEVLKFMQMADIFLFPSYEGGGMVVIEAMAAGKPVVCLHAGGPGEAVTEDCGIKVEVHNIDQIVQELSDGLYTLAKRPLLRCNMGEAAKQRVWDFYEWNRKGEQIQRIYELVCSKAIC